MNLDSYKKHLGEENNFFVKVYNNIEMQGNKKHSIKPRNFNGRVENNDNLGSSSPLGNFYRIYFDFLYYLGVCPFRLRKEVESGCFHAKTWRPQQILCALLTILGIFRLIAVVRNYLPESQIALSSSKNPIPYFQILLSIFHLFQQMVTVKKLWFNGKQFAAVLNLLEKERERLPVSESINKITTPYFSYAIFGFTTIELMLCICMIGGYDFVDPIWSMSPSWWLRRTVAFARYTFCFGDRIRPPPPIGTAIGWVAPQLSEVTVGDGFLIVLQLLGQFHRTVMVLFADMIILVSALTLWSTAYSLGIEINKAIEADGNNCPEDLKIHKQNEISQVMPADTIKIQASKYQQPWPTFFQNFKTIHTLQQAINESLGSRVTWFMAEGLMWYSANLHKVVISDNEPRRIVTIIFYLITGGILYLSGDICFQLETLRAWLLKKGNGKNVPGDEANVVLHALDSSDIGIKCSNIITVSYSVVAGYVSLIVTFFIICVQYQNDLQNKG